MVTYTFIRGAGIIYTTRRVHAGNILTYFIEIERVFAGHGTVEPRFQEARPSVAERMRSALVVLAYSTDPRVHRLKHKCDPLAHEQFASFDSFSSLFRSRRPSLSSLTCIWLLFPVTLPTASREKEFLDA